MVLWLAKVARKRLVCVRDGSMTLGMEVCLALSWLKLRRYAQV